LLNPSAVNLFASIQQSANSRPIPPSTGLSVRPAHHEWIVEHRPRVAWFEVHAERFTREGGRLAQLDSIASRYPLSLHAVGLSLGSRGVPDPERLGYLCKLAERLQPELISEELSSFLVNPTRRCAVSARQYSQEDLQSVVRHVIRVQDALDRQILLKNAPELSPLPDSTRSQVEFLAEVVLRTGCGLLLDIGNLYTSAKNQCVQAELALFDFLDSVPADAIGEMHLRGPRGGPAWNDASGLGIASEVVDLYRTAVRELGRLPTLVEEECRSPHFDASLTQAARADAIAFNALYEGVIRASDT
jgi:uncharacterized protein